jgi:pyridoxamine 5'-phosphate oxidase
VLLSSVSREGLSFHTDAASRKASQIRTNPAVAITVLWPGFTRQLAVRGRAEPADPAAVAAAYAARSPYLQQLAWLNTHDFAALPLDERRARWATAEAEREARVVTAGGTGLEAPPTWTGFVVRPTRVTAWSSAPDTASRREEWSLGDAGWTHSYRAG